MATTNQKQAFNLVANKVRKGEKISIGNIMRKVGYSESTSKHPAKLTEAKGWQELLAKIDDDVILTKITEILQGDDKRSSLTAADMLLKLKDKYPASKSKIQAYTEETQGLNE